MHISVLYLTILPSGAPTTFICAPLVNFAVLFRENMERRKLPWFQYSSQLYANLKRELLVNLRSIADSHPASQIELTLNGVVVGYGHARRLRRRGRA